ncbi:MAG: sulfate adenylyltransferase [Firmicutes bacterium]|nr:sulfate adenylyltransferase [Alicyclobacillaceae bacterium]MCL6496050.1 sulfate adenylyltransferase [Bacillota bacterium]
MQRLSPEVSQAVRQDVLGYPRLVLDRIALADLYQLGTGAYTPLEGFVGQDHYTAILERMELAHGQPWPIPITLPLRGLPPRELPQGRPVALADATGTVHGVLWVTEVYTGDPEREAEQVFGTKDRRHPGVAALLARGATYVAGPVRLLADAEPPDLTALADPEVLWTPKAVRESLARLGWRKVAGFQTRNPLHWGHLRLIQDALTHVDGVLLHPLVGPTKPDDVPASVRWACYRAALAEALPSGRVLLAAFTGPMRYAGPREALLHAIVRRNFGCTHFVVGRDHAGVGQYYTPDAAQRMLEVFAPRIGIQALAFGPVFWCTRCQAATDEARCPHPDSARVALSGTALRAGTPPSAWAYPPAVAAVLSAYQAGQPVA